MREEWDKRYNDEKYIYGELPNDFLKEFIDSHKAGKILFPSEGEGRNSVYTASKGWLCDAFDYSETAKNKAIALAKKNNVEINYNVCDIADYAIKPDYYDTIALIFVHIPTDIRKTFFVKLADSLAVGGHIVIQVFSKKQVNNSTGGPKDINLLYSADDLIAEFINLEVIRMEEKEIFLKEGSYHNGESCVIEAIFRKK